MFSRLVLAVLVTSSAACSMTGLQGGRKTYNAPSLAMPAVQHDIFGALFDVVREQKWTVVKADAKAGYLEAIAPADVSLGVAMRERWTFAVTDYEVKATRVLEVAFEANNWQREDVVCTGYVYLREHEVLDHVERRVAQLGSVKKYAQIAGKVRT